jgi:hypothetical protein
MEKASAGIFARTFCSYCPKPDEDEREKDDDDDENEDEAEEDRDVTLKRTD